jgi:hypothetical protein
MKVKIKVMNFEFEKDNFLSLNRLSANSHYYNEVFKRAERIASVVFYVLSYIETNSRTSLHHQNLSQKAMQVHEAAITSLNLHEYEAKDGLHDFLQAVVALESTLHLASAARVVTADVDRVISEEIDVLQRVTRNHYLGDGEDSGVKPSIASSSPSSGVGRSEDATHAPSSSGQKQSSSASARATRPKGDMSSQATTIYGAGPDRVERIKTVLEAKGEATIKDIAEVITDCSEKTIQRDLNSLIDSGHVIRHGERRWSRYTINKS